MIGWVLHFLVVPVQTSKPMAKPIVIDISRFSRLPQGMGKKIVLGLALIMAIIVLNTFWYSVKADEQAVKLRFGRVVETRIPPGLHFKLPLGIETVDIFATQRQLLLEFGSDSTQTGSTNPYQYGSDDATVVKNMVTGDLNAAHVEWVVQYRVSDLEAFLYKVRDPEETLRDVSESVMREIVGDRTVDEVLTVGRQEIQVEARKRISEVSAAYDLGTQIDDVLLKGVNPPPPVRKSFDEVNRAQQEREENINIARGEYNKVVPKAKGEADQKISSAEGDALKRVNEATGEAARFTAVYSEYTKAPEITRRRLYMETMQEVLPLMGRKVVIDSDARSVLPFLPIQSGMAPSK